MELSETPHAPMPVHHSNDEVSVQKLLENNFGYVVGRLNDELLRFHSDAHFLTISPTGGGKTTGAIIPNLLDHPGSAFVIDIRGETVAKTAHAKRLQGQHVVVLDPYNITGGMYGKDSYNPFDRITQNMEDPTNDDRIQRMVQALMFDPHGRKSNEPIWDNATKNLMTGLIKYVLYHLPEYRHNLGEVLEILNYSSVEMEMFVDELLSVVDNNPNARDDQHIKGLVKILTENRATTKITDNAVVQAQTYLTWVGNRSFKDMVSRSTFSFDDLQERRMTVYLVIPEEFIDNCATWARLIIESAVFSTKDVVQNKGISTSQLSQNERVLFLLDELPAFGQLDIISKGMATLRGRGINLWLFIQNIAQLQDVYDEKKARTIIGNASCIQVFKSDELEELEYFSKLVGEEFIDVQSVSFGETQSSGTSVAEGKSYTISNSESFSQSKGISDSYAQSSSKNWGESFTKSRNKSRTTGSGEGGGSGWNYGWNWGSNSNDGSTYERNTLSSSRLNDTYGKGHSSGSNLGYNRNSNWNRNKSSTSGSGSSRSKNQGFGTSETNTHSVNQSSSQTRQKGTSEGTSHTETTSENFGLSRTVSVKKERMKLETVRTLREKLSRDNQLLLVKGEHPFFCQKMSYFAKFTDVERFIFPDFMALSTLNVGQVLVHHGIADRYLDIIKDCELLLEEWQRHYDTLAFPAYTQAKNAERVVQTQNFITSGAKDLGRKLKDIISRLPTDKGEFGYSSIALMSVLSSCDFENVAEIFEEFITTINEKSEQLSTLSLPNSEELKNKRKEYKELPIMEVQTSDDENVSDDGYMLNKDDLKWLNDLYRPLIKDLLESAKKDIETVINFALAYNAIGASFNKVSTLTEQTLISRLQERLDEEERLKMEFLMVGENAEMSD